MAEPPGNAALDDLLPVAPEEVLFVYELPIDHLPRNPINCHMQQYLFLPSTMTSPQTSGGVYPQLVEIQLRFHLFPWHARFAGIAFNCAAQLDKVFHVLDTLLKPTHFSSERLQGWFPQTGDVTHRLAFDA